MRRFRRKILAGLAALGLAAGLSTVGAKAASASSPVYYTNYHGVITSYQIQGSGNYLSAFYIVFTNENSSPRYLSWRILSNSANGFQTAWSLDYLPAWPGGANNSYGVHRYVYPGTYCLQYDIYGYAVGQSCAYIS